LEEKMRMMRGDEYWKGRREGREEYNIRRVYVCIIIVYNNIYHTSNANETPKRSNPNPILINT
jgi:hypothetical protein